MKRRKLVLILVAMIVALSVSTYATEPTQAEIDAYWAAMDQRDAGRMRV